MGTLTRLPRNLLLAAFALCAPLAAQSQVVAVMEPVAGSANVTSLNKGQVRGAMEDFLTRSRAYRVVDRRRADQVLSELRLQRSSAMIDPGTAKEIGRHLSADFVCVSEIVKEEAHTNINISLINVTTGVVQKSGSETVFGDSPAVVRAATERIASKITGIRTDEQAATLRAMRRTVTFGLYASAGIPMGEFGGVEFPATADFPVPQTEGYTAGFGGRFTMTFPLLFRYLGLRAGAGLMYNGGSNTATGYTDIKLTYLAMGASAELQVFFDESYRHRGTYLFGGATVNNESFQKTGSNASDDFRKMRFGGTAGLGHTFSPQGGRGGWTLELAYHTTLSGKDPAAGEPVSADHLRLSAGYVF
jgi:hypothetical protein